MTVKLPFVQNQTYQGIMAHFEKTVDGVVSDLDISGATEITCRVFTPDLQDLRFSGTLIGDSKVTFYTDGTDGKCVYNTQAGDMALVETDRGEFEVLLGGKKIKMQGLLVEIKPESPTS